MSDHSDTTPEKEAKLAFEKWQVEFLKWLRKKGNIAFACRKAKIDRKWAYEKKERDPFFAEAWKDALAEAVEGMEEEAHRRAVDGTSKPIYHGGKKVGSVKEYSDTLLIFLLKAHAPNKYRENHRHEHVIPTINLRPDLIDMLFRNHTKVRIVMKVK